ncbi:MAG: ATP synthase F1 subunit delta [Phycisphaerae bacterium]|nr:ATP synthase F1 subunit delta [Phycisphaerae bacterium]MBN8597646.1 ATP synthase F1 subunit delta [Planctomycetota bacterium]
MPLSQTKPDALANIYAKSLYAEAFAAGGRERVEAVQGQFEDLLEMTRTDKTFNEFLASRVIPTTEREEALKKILGGRIDELLLRFVLVVNRKDRLGHIVPIAAAYDQVVQQQFGRVEVDVVTASAIEAQQLASVKSRLGEALGKEVVVHSYTDPTMIGGVKFRIGDQLIDASVQTTLRKIRDQLSTQGDAVVRGKINRIIED